MGEYAPQAKQHLLQNLYVLFHPNAEVPKNRTDILAAVADDILAVWDYIAQKA